MPTIVDSLIVTLGLDSKNFTQGQKAAVLSLRNLQQQASTTSTNVQRSSTGIVTFFQNVQHPVNALHQAFVRLASATMPTSPLQRNLTQVAAQGRVAGAGVQAGALAGASGLRILGATGVAAFAAIAVGYKAMEQAKENANQVFRTGLGAAGAGMNITSFGALSQTLLKNSNIPERTTQSWLEQTRLWQYKLRYNEGKERLPSFQQVSAGINSFTDTPEQMLQKLARRFSDRSEFPSTPEGESKAIAEGSRIGLSPDLVQGLRKAGPNLAAQAAKEGPRAPKPEDLDSANDLLQSTNNLSIAWANLSRIMWRELNPGIQKLADLVAYFVTLLSNKKPNAWFNAITGSKEGDPRNVWERYAPKTFGGKDAPGKTGQGQVVPLPKGGASGMQDELTKEFIANGISPGDAAAMAAKLAVINKYEAPGGNVLNEKGDSTSSGWWQFTDPTWKDTVPGHVDKYPRAINAPKNVQAAAAAKLLSERGYQPWAAMTPERIAEAEAAATAARAAVGVNVAPLSGMANSAVRRSGGMPTGWPFPVQKGNISFPQGGGNWDSGPNGVTSGPGFPNNLTPSDENNVPGTRIKLPPPSRGDGSNLDLIRRHNAAAQTSNVSNTTNHAGVNTGDINVHTQATSPDGIGGAVQGAIKRMVTESNTGLM